MKVIFLILEATSKLPLDSHLFFCYNSDNKKPMRKSE